MYSILLVILSFEVYIIQPSVFFVAVWNIILLNIAETMDKYDFVIHGASGFTGQYVVEYVHRAAQEQGTTYLH